MWQHGTVEDTLQCLTALVTVHCSACLFSCSWPLLVGRGVQKFVGKWHIITQLGTWKFEFGTTGWDYKENRSEKGSLEHGVEEEQ